MLLSMRSSGHVNLLKFNVYYPKNKWCVFVVITISSDEETENCKYIIFVFWMTYTLWTFYSFYSVKNYLRVERNTLHDSHIQTSNI